MTIFAYARTQVAAAARLMRFDAAALAAFDRSPAAAARSFLAALVLVPGVAALILFQQIDAQTGIDLAYLASLTLSYIVAWLFYLVVMERLCAWMDFGPRFPLFVAAYNWAMVVQVFVFLPIVAIATLALPAAGGAPFVLIANLALLIAQGFVTQIALKASAFTAVAFVALDVLAGVSINAIAGALLRGGGG